MGQVEDKIVVGNVEFCEGRCLGKGGFSKVNVLCGVSSKEKRIFVIKQISKRALLDKSNLQLVMREKDILASLSCLCPFVTTLFCTLQNSKRVMMVVDYFPGGSLRFHLDAQGSFSEERVRFYATQIILALEYLHFRHIAYRDLKPDNLTLDKNGYCHLIDFNGAIELKYGERISSHGFVGTNCYMPPEAVSADGMVGIEVFQAFD
eukprot:TRINITY_DN4908_c0_g1_i1.p1 TRINITY_DN4908_c0_g1~~TRINITY_DN4908_c0_g1_i1.p1  ORF type:complete len:217 (-),score=40.59 TRINITY_DN4908_c0_g1_i1:1142-1759(-)